MKVLWLIFIYHFRFLKDKQWYFAVMAAPIFWFLYDAYVQTAAPKSLFEPMSLFFVSVVLYPILEELVFRGWLQSELLKRHQCQSKKIGISLANLSTSLLFAALHLVYHPALIALSIIAPSLIFGYFRDRFNSTLPSMGLHILYNAGFIYLFSTP